MRELFTNLTGALGMAVACLVPVFALSGLVRADEKKTANLAQIKLSGALAEAPVAIDPLFGSSGENFKSKLEHIKKAAEDPEIQGLYLNIDDLGIRWGKLYELRKAIADFRKSGKKAFAYLESGASMDYLAAAACDEVCIPEGGWLMLTGMRGEVSFYKDLLDKLGVRADMLQMGAFKGAAEPMTRSSMSPQFRKQFESVLDDFYEQDLINGIAEARAAKKLTPERVRQLIDQGPYTARAAAAAGLIDRVDYPEQFQHSLKKELKTSKVKIVKNYGQPKEKKLDFSNPFSLLQKLMNPQEPAESRKPNKIAVIYATGVIVSGKSSESLLDGETMGSTTMIEAIRQAEQDKTVKAIVLRVDSPGGSALASDLIWNELKKSKKPVVASMSDVAASGGYYISMAAQKIYAEPGTLTGSIGVIGGKVVIGGLYDKIGLKTETITRGAHANILSSTTPFSDSERAAMTSLMKDVYNQFLDKAIQGRAKAGKKFSREEFGKLAEGRIWTGRQAKAHGLVDELGTLKDAIDHAKTLAGLDKKTDADLLILPKAKSFLDMLLESKTETRLPFGKAPELSWLHGLPEITEPLRFLRGFLMLRSEPVWAILPCRIEVR